MRTDPRRREADAYPWIAQVATRFGDMDVNRHLNNVAVARLYEEVRVRFNGHLRTLHDLQPHYLVGHVAIDYLGEGRYPLPATIGYGIASFGRASFRAAMAMFQNGRCIGLCDTVMVYRGDAGPAPIPEVVRAMLGEWTLRP